MDMVIDFPSLLSAVCCGSVGWLVVRERERGSGVLDVRIQDMKCEGETEREDQREQNNKCQDTEEEENWDEGLFGSNNFKDVSFYSAIPEGPPGAK